MQVNCTKYDKCVCGHVREDHKKISQECTKCACKKYVYCGNIEIGKYD